MSKILIDEATVTLALEALEDAHHTVEHKQDAIGRIKAITALREALAEQPAQQEPVAMRMPKVGDEVICIEDESLGMVAYLTAGGSPEIRFDDGSHGTYMLREFAELFRYTTPQPAQRKPLTNLDGLKMACNRWLNNLSLRDAYLLGISDAEAAHGIKDQP